MFYEDVCICPSGRQVLMDLHGGFKKWSIWICVETRMCLLPCWVYVCGMIIRISHLLRGGQANVGNIFEPSPNWLLNVQFKGEFREGGSQVTAPSFGCDKYTCLKHNFFPLSQYSASDSRQDVTGGPLQICVMPHEAAYTLYILV